MPPVCPRSSRATRALADETGLALMEVVVSAAVLAVIALAVLAGVDAAGSSAGRERARTVAASLAEQDQERLRAMNFIDLTQSHPDRDVAVDGVIYTVSSSATTISDDSGATPSCTNSSSTTAYTRIVSTVRVKDSGLVRPFVLTSLVAPPITGGWLAVQLRDRADGPVTAMPVGLTGPDSRSATTNSEGCALFGPVRAGDYVVRLTASGWVGDKGQAPAEAAARVSGGKVTTTRINYDRAGTVRVKFDTKPTWARFAEGGATDPAPLTYAGAVQDDAGHSVTAAHPSGMRTFFGATPPAEPRTGLQTAAPAYDVPLYPFSTAYGLHGGSCAGQHPVPAVSPTYFDTYPGRQQVDPGGLYGSPNRVVLREPAMNLTVLDRNRQRAPSLSTPTINVVLTYTSPDGGCKERISIRGTNDPASPIHPRSALSCRPTPGGRATDPVDALCAAGTHSIAGTLRHPGVPYAVPATGSPVTDKRGRWEVCVDDGAERVRETRITSGALLKEARSPDGVTPFKVDLVDREPGTCAQRPL